MKKLFLILCLILLASVEGFAAVTFDTRFEKGFSSQTSPASYVSNAGDVTGTVGSGADRIMVCFIYASGSLTTPAMTWNSSSMTAVGTPLTLGAGFVLYMFAIDDPASGNQTLATTWTGGAVDIATGCIAVAGSSGWQNPNNAGPTTSTAPTLTITSANGNFAVAALADNNSPSATIGGGATSAWNERDLNGNFNAGYLASSSGSTVISWTIGSSVEWGVTGIDLVAAGGGGAVQPRGTLTGILP